MLMIAEQQIGATQLGFLSVEQRCASSAQHYPNNKDVISVEITIYINVSAIKPGVKRHSFTDESIEIYFMQYKTINTEHRITERKNKHGVKKSEWISLLITLSDDQLDAILDTKAPAVITPKKNGRIANPNVIAPIDWYFPIASLMNVSAMTVIIGNK